MATAKEIKNHASQKIKEWTALLNEQGRFWEMYDVQKGEIQLLEYIMDYSNKKEIISYLKEVKREGKEFIEELGDTWESYDTQLGEIQAAEYLLDWINNN